MWYDEAVEGLMSQDVLRGRFPFFFYGQPVHGVADRYVAALVLLVFGSSPVTLKLAMLPFFFVFLGSVAYTTRRMFGTGVALVAALLVAVPGYYYFGWSLDSRGHYALMLVLGVWLLFLTWRIVRDGVGQAPARRFVGLGLMAGVAWWTNYLSVTFLVPIALALVAGGVRAGLTRPATLRRGAIALGFFVVGTAPVLAYYLPHELPLVLPGRAPGGGGVPEHVAALGSYALPQILGVHPDIWTGAYAGVYLVVLGASAAVVLYGVAWWVGRRRTGGDPGIAGLLIGVVVVTLMLATLTRFGALLRYPRYLLPLYLALPVLFGLALERVGRRSRILEGLAVAALVVNNLLGSLVLTPVLASASTVAFQQRWPVQAAEQLAFLEQHGLRWLYGGPNHWPFLSDRRVISSDPYQERMSEFVREVDAADRIGWIFRQRSGAFEASLGAAGITYRVLPGPGFVAYADFALPPTGYADLDPAGWTASATHAAEDAAQAFDGRLDSAWRTRVRQAPGHAYRLDLGAVRTVGLVAWLPVWLHEMPTGFAVRVSADGREWREVARVPQYVGPLYWSGRHPFQRIRRSRMEVRFPPAEARHVAIELLGEARHPWGMREIFVGTPIGPCPGPLDPGALVDALLRRGVRVVHADHWISANVARLSHGAIATIAANKSITSYRLERPEPSEIEAVPLKPDRAIVVEACPAQVAAAAAGVLEARGVTFERETAGGYVAFTGLRTPGIAGRPVPWRATGQPGEFAIDLEGSAATDYLVLECEGSFGAVEPELLTWEAGGEPRPTPYRAISRATLRMTGSRLFLDPPRELVLRFESRHLAGARVSGASGPAALCPVRGARVG
jgi:hypothetical protein